MKFFSGFSLQNEDFLFIDFIDSSDYTVCGFSCGAIKAFEHVKGELACGKRVDKLQLFSPAFFQTKPVKFKKLQLMAYRKNRDGYLTQFIESCFLPHAKKMVECSNSTLDELDELLNYEWNLGELQTICDRGVKIEVYLGSEDKIIDAESARKFFLQISAVTYIKNANHFLQIN
ncbi:MAG: pimelyl-ACP methyl ester esterase BioV [Campylobacterota bacterium]|nr:pimelyl-ACP methyl ester esterase BioV [Campylobacterota bacterium]